MIFGWLAIVIDTIRKPTAMIPETVLTTKNITTFNLRDDRQYSTYLNTQRYHKLNPSDTATKIFKF